MAVYGVKKGEKKNFQTSCKAILLFLFPTKFLSQRMHLTGPVTFKPIFSVSVSTPNQVYVFPVV